MTLSSKRQFHSYLPQMFRFPSFGFCHSDENTRNYERSCKIDKQLERDRGRREKEYKILLLGSGESGKSTILKQMKIIGQNGYNYKERISWRAIVYRNVIESAQTLLRALMSLGLTFIDPINAEYANFILQSKTPYDPQCQLDTELAEAIYNVWKDPNLQKCIEERGHGYYLLDSAPYFFDEIKRIGHSDYIPTDQDVLRARLKSSGITEMRFGFGGIFIHMFDVGGQRSERKKWIHCFESVSSIIFCVALSEYDQVLLEESRQNRMLESLSLFESVINSRWFMHTSVMLFLNKIDVFKTKITRVPMEKYFPDYGGGKDVNKAAKYILWRFMQTNRAKLHIYPHLTQATDTCNIRFVFAAVKQTLIKNALQESGML